MFMPKIVVQQLPISFNANLICRNLSPAKAINKTRPFAEKTYSMFPELLGVLDGKNEEKRNEIIKRAVEKRLTDSAKEIAERVQYFQSKFDSFLYDFKRAFSCEICLHPPQSKTFLEYGSLDPNGIGYVYKIKSDTFTKIDDWQWVSSVSVVPEEVITIKVSDYINTVVFSEDAKEIQKKLYL